MRKLIESLEEKLEMGGKQDKYLLSAKKALSAVLSYKREAEKHFPARERPRGVFDDINKFINSLRMEIESLEEE